MPKKNATTSEILTPKEQAFVANWNGNQVETCKLAGIQPKNANRFMQRPRVKRAIEQKQFVTIVEAAKAQVKADTITREFILEQGAKIVLASEDDKAKVQALTLLAKVLGVIDGAGNSVNPNAIGPQVYRSAWLTDPKPAQA